MMQLCRLLSTAEVSHGEAVQSAHSSAPDHARDFTLSQTGVELRKGHGDEGGDLEERDRTWENAAEDDTRLHGLELLQPSRLD